jgi:hypothetical protein
VIVAQLPVLRKLFADASVTKKIGSIANNDWTKAAIVVGGGPLSLAFLSLIAINRLVRKAFRCLSHLDDDVGGGLERIGHTWAWSSIFVKSIWLGLFFVSVQVGIAKVVTLFLSFLNAALASLSLAVVTGLFVVIGFGMFMLPPVPGVPVYVSGGIILCSAGMRHVQGMCEASRTSPSVVCSDTEGFWPGLVYASAVCFFIKLMATAGEQKVIGGGLGTRVSIRAIVGVNSPSIKCIKLILSQPGCKVGKICILCGGPDWPTSVLTGILGLPLFEMVLCTLPVYFLILPCVASGAMLLRVAEGGSWSAYASLTMTFASAVQGAAGLGAVYFINRTGDHRGDEIEAMEDDPEVAILDEQSVAVAKERLAVTDWHRPGFPLWCHALLVSGAGLMSAACWIIFFRGAQCFNAFAVTDSIEEKFGGNWFNVVKYEGWVALTLCFVSYLHLKTFGYWVGMEMSGRHVAMSTSVSVGLQEAELIEDSPATPAPSHADLQEAMEERAKMQKRKIQL